MADELEPVTRAFTTREQAFIHHVKVITPKAFLETCPEDGQQQDIRLLGIGALALSDWNQFPPGDNQNFNTLNPNTSAVIVMGTEYYIMLFKQMEFTLIDIQYSDGGLSINLDRVGKINTALANFEKVWLRVLENSKKVILMSNGGMGLGTPRYQSNLSRAIAILGGGAYGWNVP